MPMRIKQYRQYTAQTPKSENVTVAGYQEAAKIEEEPANVEPARVNPIPTGLSHVITVYGLIQPIVGRNRVKKKICYDLVSVLECLMVLVPSILGDPEEEPLLKPHVTAMRIYVILELGTRSYLIC